MSSLRPVLCTRGFPRGSVLMWFFVGRRSGPAPEAPVRGDGAALFSDYTVSSPQRDSRPAMQESRVAAAWTTHLGPGNCVSIGSATRAASNAMRARVESLRSAGRCCWWLAAIGAIVHARSAERRLAVCV